MTTIHYTAPFSEDLPVPTFRAAITAIGSFFAGLWEGFVAYRRFEELTSWTHRVPCLPDCHGFGPGLPSQDRAQTSR